MSYLKIESPSDVLARVLDLKTIKKTFLHSQSKNNMCDIKIHFHNGTIIDTINRRKDL